MLGANIFKIQIFFSEKKGKWKKGGWEAERERGSEVGMEENGTDVAWDHFVETVQKVNVKEKHHEIKIGLSNS